MWTEAYHYTMSKSALVFGASGVSGWSFVNEILNDYPKKDIWRKVHALTNRPLKQSDSFWSNDPRLNIVSGIDLLQGSQIDVEKSLANIVGVQEVTHVYYLGKCIFRVSIIVIDMRQHTRHHQTSSRSIKTLCLCSNEQ